MSKRFVGGALGLAALALLAAAGSGAEPDRLPRLPKDYVFQTSPDSPGAVVFSHGSHVDAGRPSCTSCHPRAFRMLAPGRPTVGERVTHERMEAGQQCGSCHDGKAAHGLDDCSSCHR